MRKKVLIVDDHPLICEAIRQALLPIGFEAVGETADGIDALRMIESLMPDIVILDIGLEKLDGLTVLKRITREKLDVRVLVFTSQSKDSYATRCLQAGASGFVSKSEPIDKLTKAIKTIADGYVFFPKSAMPLLGKAKVSGGLDDLTDRELQILKLLAEGLSNREIAQRLSLSNKTVSGHKVNIQTKLSVASVIELGEIARQHHLI
ncbi:MULTISPECIES: response regulator transcription factor [Comamonas]|uniref:Response regulator transcription factor n=1 Tax=Comamonas avium TaxID=2762231 RepID=A0ABR8S9N0_9BURK|nr:MULTISPECIES: response regulator transcription factor [Comamonas]MBD7960155.1 response regulator transcription factor [Comamonas avium]MBD9400478.1 response regulator transcription factor [Comamonas sp. CMM02]